MPWQAAGLLVLLLAAAALMLTRIGKILWTLLFLLLGGYLGWVFGVNAADPASDAADALWWFQTLTLVGSVAAFGLAGLTASSLALQIKIERLERERRERELS